MGAASLALVGVGIYNSVKEACDAIVVCCDEVMPDFDSHDKYKYYYHIYRNLYTHLKNDFKELSSLE